MTLVDALWVGPSGYQLPQGTVNEDGQTVYKVPDFEASESDNWQPLKAPDLKRKPSDTGGTE